MEPILFSDWIDWSRGDLKGTLGVCALSLIAVWVPLSRGMLLCWRARRATRIERTAQSQGIAGMTRLVTESAESQLGETSSLPFVRDAAKQLVTDDYETNFAQPISMYANILPPIGFIGTTCGLAILLLSMRVANEELQLGALALALSSTIFALIGYAILESVKIHLYARLARAVEAGITASTDEESSGDAHRV